MNTGDSVTYKREVAIRLRDIFWFLLKQWKKLLIVMLALMLLLGGYKAFSTYKQYKAQKVSSGQSSPNAGKSSEEGAAAITAQPQSVSVVANSTASFSVTTSGKVSKYQWQYSKDGMAWSNLIATTYPSAATERLSFTALSTQNNYMYRCVVTYGDESSIASEAAILTVTAGSSSKKLSSGDVVKSGIKYGVVGLLLGVCAGAFVLAAVYVGKGYFGNGLALEDRYGKSGFGVYPREDVRSLDRKVMSKLSYWPDIDQKESAELIAANLNTQLEPFRPLLLTGTVDRKDLEKIKDALQPHVKTELELIDNPNVSAEAVKTLADGAQVVCVERILDSRQTYVDLEVRAITQSASDLLGFILIE